MASNADKITARVAADFYDMGLAAGKISDGRYSRIRPNWLGLRGFQVLPAPDGSRLATGDFGQPSTGPHRPSWKEDLAIPALPRRLA